MPAPEGEGDFSGMEGPHANGTWQTERHQLNRVQGDPGGGMQGGNALLPAGGLAIENCLKEDVSKRGRRAGCPITNPRGIQSER